MNLVQVPNACRSPKNLSHSGEARHFVAAFSVLPKSDLPFETSEVTLHQPQPNHAAPFAREIRTRGFLLPAEVRPNG